MRRDPRGNPVTTASAAALDASERALWRMMSFYGTPLDDLDAAIAADPAWLLPRLMKAGFLLSLTEPSLVGDGRGAARRGRRRSPPRRRARARPPRARCSASPPATGSAPARPGARSCATIRATRSRCSGRTCSTSTAATRRSCASASRAVLPAWPDDDPLQPYVLGAARVRPRGVGPLRRGRGGRPARARRRRRACRGRSTPSPT